MTTDIILHPLDTLKTRLQSRRLADPTLNFRSIYRGLFSQMMGTFPCNASFWIIYEGIKQELGGSVYLGGWKGLVPGVASALAECSVCTIRNPFDVVKLQLQAGMHKNSSDALRHILKADGFRGLYAGYRATRKFRILNCPHALRFPGVILHTIHLLFFFSSPYSFEGSSLCGTPAFSI